MKENRCLEYKTCVAPSFLKTVCAYANFCDGKIVFGMRDDGTPCGVENTIQACLDIENSINDSIQPRPDYRLSVNSRTNVVTLSVFQGMYKPYCYKGKAYRRSDTETVEVDQTEMRRLVLEGSNLYYEDLKSGKKELKFSILEKELQSKLHISELSEDILRTFGLYRKDRKWNIAAELLADENSFCGVDSVRFGKSINEILDRETLDRRSVLKQLEDVTEMFRRYYTYEEINGTLRERKEMIPETAFREAIANALVHRTWDVNSHIRVSMYSDRVEVTSPGGLPAGISEEEYVHGKISVLRNPLIGNVFFRLGYIEMFGTGIRRILEEYQDSTVKPRFEITDQSVTVVLPVLSETYKVTKDGQKVLDLLEKGAVLSSTEIAEETGWSKDKTIRIMNTLEQKGYTKKEGLGRATKYMVC